MRCQLTNEYFQISSFKVLIWRKAFKFTRLLRSNKELLIKSIPLTLRTPLSKNMSHSNASVSKFQMAFRALILVKKKCHKLFECPCFTLKREVLKNFPICWNFKWNCDWKQLNLFSSFAIVKNIFVICLWKPRRNRHKIRVKYLKASFAFLQQLK